MMKLTSNTLRTTSKILFAEDNSGCITCKPTNLQHTIETDPTGVYDYIEFSRMT